MVCGVIVVEVCVMVLVCIEVGIISGDGGVWCVVVLVCIGVRIVSGDGGGVLCDSGGGVWWCWCV